MTAFKHKKSSSKSFCRVQFATRWRCGSRPVLLKPVNNFLFKDSVDHNVRLHLTRCDPRLRNLSVHARGGIIKLYCHRLDPLPVSETLTSFFFTTRCPEKHCIYQKSNNLKQLTSSCACRGVPWFSPPWVKVVSWAFQKGALLKTGWSLYFLLP